MVNRKKEYLTEEEEKTACFEAGKISVMEELNQTKLKLEAAQQIFQTAGQVQALNFCEAQAAFFKTIRLKQIKESRLYWESFHMTWEQFCKHAGVARRTIDRQIDDLTPLRDDFLASLANLMETDFNKIKYLGLAVSANLAKIEENAIVYEGDRIPLSPEYKDDIAAVLDRLEIAYRERLAAQEKEAALKGKNLDSEAKTLKVEIDALVKEKVRLEVFEPKGPEDIIKRVDAIWRKFMELSSLVREIGFKRECVEDFEVRIKIDGQMRMISNGAGDLWRQWRDFLTEEGFDDGL